MRFLIKHTCLILLFGFLFSAEINENTALEVAENFYFSKNNPDNSDFIYEEIVLYNHNNNAGSNR